MKINKESMLVYAITDRHWTGEKTLEQQVDEVLKNGATFFFLFFKYARKICHMMNL